MLSREGLVAGLALLSALLGWGARRAAKATEREGGAFLPALGVTGRAAAAYLLTILSWGLFAAALLLLSLLLP